MINKILNNDSLTLLPKIPENSFHHCITDPPYNISGYDGKRVIGWYNSNKIWKEEKKFNKISEGWDSFSDDEYMIFSKFWIEQIMRIVKPNGNILIFGTYHNIYKLGSLLTNLERKINNSIIWYKRNAFPNITRRMFCESTEQIIWAVNNTQKKAKNWIFNYEQMKELTLNKKQMRNMWDTPMTSITEKKFGKHTYQKPIEVIERLVLGCTNENQSIIDPFSGSGTVSLVAKKHKRKYLGIEKNKEYFKNSKKRLKDVL